jgi:hypothetical protein
VVEPRNDELAGSVLTFRQVIPVSFDDIGENHEMESIMSCIQIVKPPLLVLFLMLIMQGCVTSTDIVVTSVATEQHVAGAETPLTPTPTALLAEPMASVTVTPVITTPDTPVNLTPIASLAPVISPTASITVTLKPDIGNLGLLVFDQIEETVGRLSFDGLHFQPLNQVPKLDVAGLEFGLFDGQSGYHVSPDGQWLSTIIGYDQLVLVDTLADQRHSIAHIGTGAWLNWSPDSQMFAYREGDATVCLYKLIEQSTYCLDEFVGKVVAAAWSIDGSLLALSIATQSELIAPGTVNGEVWLVDIATGQTQFITDQNLPIGGSPTNYLLVWTAKGLIINRLSNTSPAILIDDDSETLLAANAVSASPTGDYVIYEDGGVKRINNGSVLTHLPVCAEIEGQTMHIMWAQDESRFVYTVRCVPDASMQLGMIYLADNDLNWTSTIPDKLRLIGWSHDNEYLFFRRHPNNPQIEGYKIERLGTDPDSTFEIVADSTFLIDILPVLATETALPQVATPSLTPAQPAQTPPAQELHETEPALPSLSPTPTAQLLCLTEPTAAWPPFSPDRQWLLMYEREGNDLWIRPQALFLFARDQR